MPQAAFFIPAQVFDMMRVPTTRRGRYSVLSKEVCAHGFRKLIGIGQGRFAKFFKAIQEGLDAPPADLRFIAKANSKPPSPNREIVFEFLQELYDTICLLYTSPSPRDA